MPFNEHSSEQFQSLQGFHCMVPPEEFAQELRHLYGRACSRRADPLHPLRSRQDDNVRILDTFLTIPHSVLTTIFKEAEGRGFQLRLLALSPYSQLDRSRARAFGRVEPSVHRGEPLLETNISLRRVLDAAAEAAGNARSSLRVEPKAKQRPLFEDLLDEISNRIDPKVCELKFYDRVTDSPVYLVFEFATKGLLLDGSSAKNNPWLVFVDDPSQSNDVYDNLSRSFNDMWDRAFTRPRPYLRKESVRVKWKQSTES